MSNNQTVNDYLPLQRCIHGTDVKNLSDMELMAIIIGTGTRRSNVMSVTSDLFNTFKGLRGIYYSGTRELSCVSGIGLVKSIRIHSSFELGRRALITPNSSMKIDTPCRAWELLLPEMAGLQKEEFRILILNNKNDLLKNEVVSVGTISEAIVHPREVFRTAIKEGGSGIIIVHNHPSGNVTPSKEDIKATKRIEEVGKIVGIPLIDHIILSNNTFYSFKEEGIL